MKRLTAITCTLLLSYLFSVAAKIPIEQHENVIALLSTAKNSADVIRAEAHAGKWPKNVLDSLGKLYNRTQIASRVLVESYDSYLENYKIARKKVNLQEVMTNLQTANNAMVKYFDDNYSSFSSGQSSGIAATVIDLVFTGIDKLYDFLKKVHKDQLETLKGQVDRNRIDITFSGAKLDSSGADKTTPAADTSKRAKATN